MLKSLELFGFKSFADRTRFDFATGITGVVGPNGSGKSNVVDAIKWILGDQSAKSLRGKEMADVIFNGAAGRKPANLAEATLTFDNASGFLPVDAAEVQVGRRLWRSGDSEYLINQAPARLKDVRDLFMGTGAGTAAYNIIEQGRVDQILQTNASSRRAIFEEAAGISRFRQRRTEALRKLERVDQNLLRLTDIVDEVEARLNSLRTQAARAARYRELSEDLRATWLGLAADDHRHLSARLIEHERLLTGCDAELECLQQRREELETALTSIDRDIDGVDSRLRRVEQRRAHTREAIARHESTARHQSARRQEIESELVRLRGQRSVTAERLREAELERERLQQQLDRLAAEFDERQRKLDERRQQIDATTGDIAAAKQTLDAHRRSLPEKMRAVTAAATRLNELQAELRAARSAQQAAVRERTQTGAQAATLRNECERHNAAAREAETELAVTTERVQALRRQRQETDGRRSESQESLTGLREQRSAAAARQSVLEDLERRQQGLGIGVREILSRARTSHYPPWNRIRGSVADLLEVDLEHAALLEAALGARTQLVVIEEVEPLIDYLVAGSNPISGRVAFVAAATTADGRFEHFTIEESARTDLTGRTGVQSRADRLVRAPDDLPRLAERLLGDTWMVDTLDRALDLSAGEGRGCRFVTLAGEVLEADGTLVVGTPKSESAIVWRKSELRSVRDDLLRLDDRIAAEERRLRGLSQSVLSAESELGQAEAELQRCTDRYAEVKAAAARQQAELDRLEHRVSELETEQTRLACEAERLTADIHQAANDQATVEEALGGFQESIEQAERDVARKEHRLQTHRQRQTAEELELAKCDERLTALRATCERLDEDRRQRESQGQEAERRLAGGTLKLREIDLAWLNADAALAELFLDDEQCEQEAETHIGEKASLKTRRARLAEEEAEVRRKRRQIDERRHTSEMAVRDFRHQLTTLAQRIAEEYQVELEDVVAAGASAYAQWIRENAVAETGGRPGDSVPSSDAGDPAADGISRSDDAGESPVPPGVPAFDDVRPELEARVDRLRRKLKLMGSVDTESLGSLEELETRHGELSAQLADLQEARAALDRILRKIDVESRRLFVETFEAVREHFRELFRKLFGGGDGDILLEDPEDVLECGIDILARPPGKELKSISLMSGGEKTLTAFGLLLALFKTRPSPYCLLDEVDAALDEANVGRLLALLEDFKQTTQFIIVTHKKPTMAIADVIYGVTMEQSGVSKRLSVRFEDVSEDGEFQTGGESLRAAA